MVTASNGPFASNILQSIYDARALFVIAFVLANVLAQQLEALGLDVVASVIVLIASLPLVIVLIGALKDFGHWIGQKRTA